MMRYFLSWDFLIFFSILYMQTIYSPWVIEAQVAAPMWMVNHNLLTPSLGGSLMFAL